jgi:hypothetical protein
MKIEIEVPEGEVGKSVQEILKSLDFSARRDLARQVMADYLRTALSKDERSIFEKELCQRLRQTQDYYRNKDDGDIKNCYEFKDEMKRWKSSHERMVEDLTCEVVEHYKSQVSNVVQHEPKVQLILNEVLNIVRENLPKMIHDAVASWFLANIETILKGVGNASMALGNLDDFKKQVSDRLSRVGLA